VPQHFQESTASTEGARSADLTVKNEVFRQAETGYLSGLFFAEKNSAGCRGIIPLPGVGRAHIPCAAALSRKHGEHRRCKKCGFDRQE